MKKYTHKLLKCQRILGIKAAVDCLYSTTASHPTLKNNQSTLGHFSWFYHCISKCVCHLELQSETFKKKSNKSSKKSLLNQTEVCFSSWNKKNGVRLSTGKKTVPWHLQVPGTYFSSLLPLLSGFWSTLLQWLISPFSGPIFLLLLAYQQKEKLFLTSKRETKTYFNPNSLTSAVLFPHFPL